MSILFCGVELPNNLFLAPMAGVTDRAFRTVALELGAGLAFTEMVSAAGLARGDRKTRTYLPAPGEAGRVGVQLFGGTAEYFGEAARIVSDLPVPFIDLNFGCPARKIVRAGCGAALMREPARVRAIVTAVCSAATRPVLVKIRAGWDDTERNAVEIARIARDCGAAAVTVHGRTARQQFSGAADWAAVREVAAGVEIPVVGNGDVATAAQADERARASGCAAVMIGRGACGNPWIFREAEALRRGEAVAPPSGEEFARVVLRHYALALEEHGPRTGVHVMRRHLIWYCRGRAGAAEFRRRVSTMERAEDVRAAVEEFALGERAGRPTGSA
jgi:nifR3 family TIM-barrel protein